MWFLNEFRNEYWAYVDNLFTPEECENIITYGNSLDIIPAQISNGQVSEYRSSSVSWLSGKNEEEKWIHQRCCAAVNNLNSKFFNFDLSYIEDLQFTVYNNNNYYKKHIDNNHRSYGSRKLSFSILLSDRETFEGGDLSLHFGENPVVVSSAKQGTLVAFPSYTLHEVIPVTKGVRYSLVGWCVGPSFK